MPDSHAVREMHSGYQPLERVAFVLIGALSCYTFPASGKSYPHRPASAECCLDAGCEKSIENTVLVRVAAVLKESGCLFSPESAKWLLYRGLQIVSVGYAVHGVPAVVLKRHSSQNRSRFRQIPETHSDNLRVGRCDG